MRIIAKRRNLLAVGVLAGAAILAVVLLPRTPDQPIPASAVRQPGLGQFAPPSESRQAGEAVRDPLLEALDMGSDAVSLKRVDLLAAVGDTPNTAECNALLAALMEQRPVDITPQDHAEFQHRISLLLQRSDQVREPFARALGTLATDMRRDEIARDYALQHLRQVWEHADTGLRQPIETSLRELAAMDPALGPSALLSLHLLGSPGNARLSGLTALEPDIKAGGTPAVSDAEMEPLVGKILSEPPSASNLTQRLTALRIAGERKLPGTRESLRRIASGTAKEHALARMAAIANLAALQDPADRPLLQSLQNAGDGRIATAARRALAPAP